MPTVLKGAKILVTGANGYIALWIVKMLLEEGYIVRAAVRAESRASDLRRLFGNAEKEGELELVYVQDYTAEGAFDDAVSGVDSILHTASPVNMTSGSPQDVIEPAVNGTISVLKSALKVGPDVGRIVLTSSFSTINKGLAAPFTYTEEDWNERSLELVEELGTKAPPLEKYRTSKVLAEKAAWDLWKENKEKVKWDLVTIHPPIVFGPSLQSCAGPADLNFSLKVFWDIVFQRSLEALESMENATPTSSWVDVRDVAQAHLRAIQVEEAGGERFIIAEGGHFWQEWMQLLDEKPITTSPDDYKLLFSPAKQERILDVKCHSKEECLSAMVEEFKARDWL